MFVIALIADHAIGILRARLREVGFAFDAADANAGLDRSARG